MWYKDYLLLSPIAHANVVYVNKSAPPNGDGNSWDTAFDDLQLGIDIANTDPNKAQVWVAEGIYNVDDNEHCQWNISDTKAYSFHLHDGIEVYGAFQGWESSLLERAGSKELTILNGMKADSTKVYHVVRNVGSAVSSSSYTSGHVDISYSLLDGFTVTNGYATGPYDDGGGLHLDSYSGELIVVNCLFHALGASYRAGAIWSRKTNLTILDCQGYDLNVRRESFIYHREGYKKLTINKLEVTDVSHTDSGLRGVVAFYQAGAVNLRRLNISIASSNNTTAVSSFSTFKVCDSLFIANKQSEQVNTLYLFVIQVQYTNVADISNCTFIHANAYLADESLNRSKGILLDGSANKTVRIKNTVVYGFDSDLVNEYTSVVEYDNCAMFHRHRTTDNWYSGAFKINFSLPLFATSLTELGVIPDDSDFRPVANSQLIDAGSNTYVYYTEDLDNNNRIINDTVDIGCYEFQGE